MGMQTATVIGSQGAPRESNPEGDRGQPRRDPDVPVTCCGKPMESRLARAHDRSGQTLFVAVWHCPVCGRVALRSLTPALSISL
jgi:hypothetical protein